MPEHAQSREVVRIFQMGGTPSLAAPQRGVGLFRRTCEDHPVGSRDKTVDGHRRGRDARQLTGFVMTDPGTRGGPGGVYPPWE